MPFYYFPRFKEQEEYEDGEILKFPNANITFDKRMGSYDIYNIDEKSVIVYKNTDYKRPFYQRMIGEWFVKIYNPDNRNYKIDQNEFILKVDKYKEELLITVSENCEKIDNENDEYLFDDNENEEYLFDDNENEQQEINNIDIDDKPTSKYKNKNYKMQNKNSKEIISFQEEANNLVSNHNILSNLYINNNMTLTVFDLDKTGLLKVVLDAGIYTNKRIKLENPDEDKLIQSILTSSTQKLIKVCKYLNISLSKKVGKRYIRLNKGELLKKIKGESINKFQIEQEKVIKEINEDYAFEPEEGENEQELAKQQYEKLKDDEVPNNKRHKYYSYDKDEVKTSYIKKLIQRNSEIKGKIENVLNEYIELIKGNKQFRIIARVEYGNEGVDDHHFEYINKNIKLAKIPTRNQINIIIRYLSEYDNYQNVSPKPIYQYEGGFVVLKKKDLANMKLLATSLHYRLLNQSGLKHDKENNEFHWFVEDQDGKKHKMIQKQGSCVTDYVYNTISTYKGYRNLTHKQFIDQFKKIGINYKLGVCVNDLITFFKAYNYPVTMYALNIFREVFKTYNARKESDKRGDRDIRLCFIVNNHHLYPITDEHIKKTIAINKKFGFEDITNTVSWENVKIIQSDDELELFINGKIKEPTILMKNYDIRDVINKHTKDNILVDQFDLKTNGLVKAYIHPTTGQYVTSYDDYNERKQIVEELFKQMPCEQFKWSNQSFQQIATTTFNVKYGVLPKSQMQENCRIDFDSQFTRPLIQQIADDKICEEGQGADVIKSYSSALLHNTYDFPLYTIHDQIEPFDNKEIKCGFYKLDNVEYAFGLIIPTGWYTWGVIDWLLKNGLLKRSHILQQYLSINYLKADTFKEFVKYCFSFGIYEAKMLINSFIGQLNSKYNKMAKACIVDDYESALCLYSQSLDKDEDFSLHMLNNLFLCKSVKKERLMSDYSPIYSHVIGLGIINLMKLIKAYWGPKTQLLGVKVDAVLFLNPKKEINQLKSSEEEMDCNIEEYINKLGSYTSEHVKLCSRMVKREVVLFEKETTERGNGMILTGRGGYGKTHKLVSMFIEEHKQNPDTHLLTFTNSNVSQIKDKIQKMTKTNVLELQNNVKTFDSFVNTRMFGETKLIDKIASMKKIFVDEFTNPPNRIMNLLYFGWLKSNKQLEVIMAGDPYQMQSIDENYSINYYESPAIRQMCGRVKQLKYIESSARYTLDLKLALDKFLKTGVTTHFKFNKSHNQLNKWLCYTNNKRIELNKMVSDRVSNNKGQKVTFKYQGKTETYSISPKMPLVCTQTDHLTFINGDYWEVQDINYDTVTIKCTSIKREIQEIKIKQFQNWFTLAYAMTITKFQGSTIYEPYGVSELNHPCMNKNSVYVALSRATKYTDIHIDGTMNKKYFAPDNNTLREIKPHFDKQFQKGKIYHITLNNKYHYVGSTTLSLNERLNQHKTDKTSPVYQAYQKHKDIKIELIQNHPCNTKGELEYVENTYIKQYKQLYGDDLLNRKGFQEEKKEYKIAKNELKIKKYNIRETIINNKPHLMTQIRQGKGKRKTIVRAFTEANKEQKMEEMKREINKVILSFD